MALRAPLVLFLCRANRAASIMAEAILAHRADGRFRSASAGDVPAEKSVDARALATLRAHDVAVKGLRSKAWGEFFGLGKPPIRILIALGDVAASRLNWELDSPKVVRARWNVPDPAELIASDADVARAFEAAYETLDACIRRLLELPIEAADNTELARQLAQIGADCA
jgi:arsenate reductase